MPRLTEISSVWTKLFIGFLATLVLVQFVGWALFLWNSGLNRDTASIAIHPANVLLETGRLDDYNIVFPFQIVRDFPNGWNGQPLPYWMVYTAPAFYFTPFVAIWGAHDVTAFWVGQTLLLLALLASLFLLYRHQNSLAFNLTVLALVLTGAFKDSYLTAATNLPAMIMMVWTWRYRRTLLNHPLRFGLLLGLAHEFRPPDTLIWLIALAPAVLDRSHFRPRVLWRPLLLIATMLAVVVAFRVLSFNLGMIDRKNDHFLINLFESFNTSFFAHNPTLNEYSTVIFFIKKQFYFFRDWLTTGRFGLFSRHDIQILSLWAMASFGAALFSRSVSQAWRDVLTLFTFTAGIIVFAHTGLNLSRYYDTVAIALALFIMEWGIRPSQITNRGAAMLLRGLSVLMLVFSFAFSILNIRYGLAIDRESTFRENGRHLATILSPETRIMTGYVELWFNYAGGKIAVWYESDQNMQNVYEDSLARAFKPQAYIHYFLLPPGKRMDRDSKRAIQSLPSEFSGLKRVPGFPLTDTHPIALYVDDQLAQRIANSPYASWMTPIPNQDETQDKAEPRTQAADQPDDAISP